VRDAPAERLSLAPLRIHMVRVEIAGLARVQHEVGLRDGAAHGLTARACLVIFEILFADHLPSTPYSL